MKRFITRFTLILAFALPFLVLDSCTKEEDMPNSATLASEVVDFESVGQFLSVETGGLWSISVQNSSPEGWVEVTPSTGEGSNNAVMVLYSKNDTTYSRVADLRVWFEDGQTITLHLEQKGKASEDTPGGGEDPGAGGDDPGSGSDDPGTGNDDPGTGNDDPVVDQIPHTWLELPYYQEDSDWMYVSHHTTLQNRQVRNYSMCYDTENRIALWVAYPLCSMYMGSQGRSDAWGYDPKIPQEYQPVLSSGWPERGYDRGHQLPSGSRNAAYHENSQTFYYTNMTAQISSFNQGVWANLENKVRGFASSCDTLYVVTGPILTTTTDSEIEYTEDRAGNEVAVPKAYFKVVMKYNISSNTYYSIGFYYKNEKYSRSQPEVSDLRTVKQIEELTGFEFFKNLPDDIEESVKNQYEPNKWGFN